MSIYRRLGIQALGWSLLLAVVSHYARQGLNPFLAVIVTGFLVLALLLQVFFLRQRGLRYIGVFVICVALLTVALGYADRRISGNGKRYYAKTE
ncbi:hypothetical protein [Spirosoma utsteinense]|uniref:Membrane protein n=1 Tax=Spirosoma utsteinense TaxID=2585773 RepID=A0ABR6W557_9BACT|nr:hypothetical protein [Spirosoma utsteinense]MBC3785582.1 putative membrane protein [Spirosoma utsteinense]MBC3791731.1 putative membrane protein [Spirosoma utsteinense]